MAKYEIKTVLNNKIINTHQEEKIKALDVINEEINKSLSVMDEREENAIKININMIYEKSEAEYISFILQYLSKNKIVSIKGTTYRPYKRTKEATYIKMNKEDLKDLVKALYKIEQKEFNKQLLTSKERKLFKKRYKEESPEERYKQLYKKWNSGTITPEETEELLLYLGL